MVHSILLALDETKASGVALDLALSIANQLKVHITGIGILDVPWLTRPQAVPMGATAFKKQHDVEFVLEAKKRLLALESSFKEVCEKSQCDYTLIDIEGDPVKEIEKVVVEHDILILGRDAGFHFLLEQDISDFVETLVKRSVRPIILAAPKELKNKQLILCYDGTPAAARAIHMALLLGLYQDRDVHIISVNPHLEEAKQYTHQIDMLCRRYAIGTHLHAIESREEPAQVIEQIAHRLKADLIVIGAYGHRGFSAIFSGSTTKGLIENSKSHIFLYC